MLNSTESDLSSASECGIFCVQISAGNEWYILTGGLCVTAFIVAFAAYSKAKVKLQGIHILSILIDSGDAFTDVAFTAQRLGVSRRRRTTPLRRYSLHFWCCR